MRTRSLAAQAATFFLTASATAQSLRAANHTYSDLYALHLAAAVSIAPSADPEAADGGQVASDALGDGIANGDQAILWNMNSGTGMDLNPVGFSSSSALGTDGSQQVGEGNIAKRAAEHALLWYGTAVSAVDLNPNGFTMTVAYGTNGNQEVGSGEKAGTMPHALLWRGSAASFTDLNPSGFTSSEAEGTNGRQQIGQGYGKATGMVDHALLWSGSAKSAVDLNPTKLSGIQSSFGLGIGGSQQVGYGIGAGKIHLALLWQGTAASAVNLNPAGFKFSVANGTNGSQQVGYGYGTSTDNEDHALLWSGNAKSYVDLGALLPSKFISSFAFSINAEGDVFGYAKQANGNYDAIEWSVPAPDAPIPEPAGAAVLGLGGIALLRWRPRDGA